LWQECCSIERKDHTVQTKPYPVARDFVKVPLELAVEAPQRGVHDCQPFLCEQDSIIPNVKSEDIFHSKQSPFGQNCSANIHRIHGDLPVLSHHREGKSPDD
jgi:hypothetical protein